MRAYFKWLTRQNVLLWNPASEIELPRVNIWHWDGGSWWCVDAAATEGSITTMDESGRTLTPFSLRS